VVLPLTPLLGLAVSVPLALGGEAEGAGSVGLGVISIVSIALGWIGLGALWWFVFRDKDRPERSKKDKRSSH
jgi:hypothetical protein